MPFFVMLVDGERKRPLPMMNDEDQVAVFKSRSTAHVLGRKNPLGKAYGFKVFPWPFEPAEFGAGFDEGVALDEAGEEG